jgi:hypothetical protein
MNTAAGDVLAGNRRDSLDGGRGRDTPRDGKRDRLRGRRP